MSIVGVGGLMGIGAPFMVPWLWLVARHSEVWERSGWTLVASLCAASGSWLVAIPLGVPWTKGLAITVAIATEGIFLLTTRSRPIPSLTKRPTDDVG